VSTSLRRMLAGFDGHHIEVALAGSRLASQLDASFAHLLGRQDDSLPIALRLSLEEHESYVELRDSASRSVAGSDAYVLHSLRLWMIDAWAAARPHLLWLHASAAACGDGALVVAGPSAVGKSTLATELVARGWTFLCDDAAPIDVERGLVLPLPFAPARRACGGPHAIDARDVDVDEWPKSTVSLPASQVARAPAPLRAIVLPTYDAHSDRPPALEPLTALSAAHALLTRCARGDADAVRATRIFDLARRVRCHQLVYGPETRRAAELLDDELTNSDPAVRRARQQIDPAGSRRRRRAQGVARTEP